MEQGVLWWLGMHALNIKGRNEYQMFKNYMNIIQEKNLISCINVLFNENKLKVKSNCEAEVCRMRGNACVSSNLFDAALHWYTKSLCYTTYNGREYAVVLANRAAVFFEMKDYQNCIMDINLCLQAKYSNELKPRILIQKAKCFKEMGQKVDMREALAQALNAMDDLAPFAPLRSTTERYLRTIAELITAKVLKTSSTDNKDKTFNLPTLDENPSFLNASNAIDFQYNKDDGYHVVAKEEIKRGDVLFVEKAFAFAPIKTLTNVEPVLACETIVLGTVRAQRSCQYCLLLLTSCIPCKKCVKHVYCNDKCRDAAWEEFHQWECFGVRAGIFSLNNHGYLAFRIMLKAVFCESGIPSNIVNEGLKKYGEKDNNYPFVYNLPSNINKIDNGLMAGYVAIAAVLTHYLHAKTTFFDSMKKCTTYVDKDDEELMNIVGSLLIHHCAQLHCNLIPMLNVHNTECETVKTMNAMTICPSVAIMKHSCLPNTAYYSVGDTIVVKATEVIKANEEVFRSYSSALTTIAYIELTYAKNEMRPELLKEYFFLTCKCRVCIDPKMNSKALDAYLCIECGGPAVLVADDDTLIDNFIYQCLDCHVTFCLPNHVTLKEYLVKDSLTKFVSSNNLEDGNRTLEVSKTIYVSSHLLFAILHRRLIRHHHERGNTMEMLELVKERVIFCKKRYINFGFDTAIVILQLSKIGIIDLKKTRSQMPMQNIRVSANILKELLNEAKELLDFHCPLTIPKVDKMIKSLEEIVNVYMEFFNI